MIKRPAAHRPTEDLTLPQGLPDPWRPTPEGGLSDTDADILRRAGRSNQTTANPGRSVLRILADNLFTVFNLLNVGLAVALMSVQAWRNMLFLGVVVSNTLIGTIQELRAKRTVERLRLLTLAPVRVLRGGSERQVPVDDLVQGDLIRLSAGEQIPADAILTGGICACSEAMLTGEQDAVHKKPGDWLYSGSYLLSGTCICQLVHVGDESYVNRLSRAAKQIEPPHSALMQDLQKLIRIIGIVLVPLGILLFLKQYFVLHQTTARAVTGSVAAVLGMIPEGLMLLTSVALAVGVVRLGRRRTLVQDLYGIESLARVDTLCLDKTGTLTTGSMAVSRMIPLSVSEEELRRQLSRFLGAIGGTSPTLTALSRSVLPGHEPAKTILPFSSDRKLSAVSFEDSTTLVLGAPSFVLGYLYDGEIREQVEAAASAGLRVVVLARCHGSIRMNDTPPVSEALGLFLLTDELRPEASNGLRYFREQGVSVRIISGDDPRTAATLAERAGLNGASAHAVDVSLLKDEELPGAVEDCVVFGRVTPDRKQALVAALQARGHNVAMVGDGVNDIPALKKSDCSIAMASGADAARRASQLILLDSDFSVLPDVVAEGRRVINNVTRTASLFLVKTIFSFVLTLLMLLLPAAYPFQPIQLTLISALTIGIPSFFLALESNHERIRGQFLRTVFYRALPGGLAVTLCAAVAALLEGSWSTEICSTVATVAAGCMGLCMLLTVCLPLTRMRAILLGTMAASFAVVTLLLGRVFYLMPLSAGQCWVLAGLILAGGAILFTLRHFLRKKEAAA